jgi:hypothetical protein
MLPGTASLAETCWRDDLWLQTRGFLNPATALEYFCASPFYDPDSNNEFARRHGLKLTELP